MPIPIPPPPPTGVELDDGEHAEAAFDLAETMKSFREEDQHHDLAHPAMALLLAGEGITRALLALDGRVGDLVEAIDDHRTESRFTSALSGLAGVLDEAEAIGRQSNRLGLIRLAGSIDELPLGSVVGSVLAPDEEELRHGFGVAQRLAVDANHGDWCLLDGQMVTAAELLRRYGPTVQVLRVGMTRGDRSE